VLKKIFFAWLPLACLTTLFSLLAYVLVQQDIRQSANDPLIQMAEDQIQPQNLPTVDISQSLAPFTIIFDNNGQPISSSGTLNGSIPTIPLGVFQYVRMSGEDRFTWEPMSGVRIAAVVDHFVGAHPGFILAGRNIREVEKREDHALFITGAAWLFGICGLFIIQSLVSVIS
jgi:hypothetical protein